MLHSLSAAMYVSAKHLSFLYRNSIANVRQTELDCLLSRLTRSTPINIVSFGALLNETPADSENDSHNILRCGSKGVDNGEGGGGAKAPPDF